MWPGCEVKWSVVRVMDFTARQDYFLEDHVSAAWNMYVGLAKLVSVPSSAPLGTTVVGTLLNVALAHIQMHTL